MLSELLLSYPHFLGSQYDALNFFCWFLIQCFEFLWINSCLIGWNVFGWASNHMHSLASFSPSNDCYLIIQVLTWTVIDYRWHHIFTCVWICWWWRCTSDLFISDQLSRSWQNVMMIARHLSQSLRFYALLYEDHSDNPNYSWLNILRDRQHVFIETIIR